MHAIADFSPRFDSARRAAAPTATGSSADPRLLPAGHADPFAARCGRRLPRGLRTEAAGLTWTDFHARYEPTHGPARLGAWSAGRIVVGRTEYEATIALHGTIHQVSARASGPVAAMTSMLHDLGLHLEILTFHRFDTCDGQATFLECEWNGRRAWSMGTGDSGTESALRAMVAGVNRLAA